MDGNKKTLRRAALPTLALAVLALPLAGAGAQDAPGQQPLVADLSAEARPVSLTDERVPAADAFDARCDRDLPGGSWPARPRLEHVLEV